MSSINLVSSYESFVGDVAIANGHDAAKTQLAASANDIKLSVDDRSLYSNCWNAAVNFTNEHNLLANGVMASTMLSDTGGEERFNTGTSLGLIGRSSIEDLVNSAGINPEQSMAAIKAIGQLLNTHLVQGSSDTIRNTHWTKGRSGLDTPSMESYACMYPSAITTMLSDHHNMPSFEAFGANTDKVITDIRVAIALTLLRFHKSILGRIVHQRNRASTVVQYETPWAESYDVSKTQNVDGDIRNDITGQDHRTFMLDLYRNPIAVTQKLQPIIPDILNDSKKVLQSTGIIKFGTKANLLDLSLDANRPGYSHADWTDLVSDGARVDKVFVALTANGVTEKFAIDMSQYAGFSMQMSLNTPDSAIRQCQIDSARFKFDNTTLTVAGAESTILANCDDKNFLVVDMFFAGTLNYKTAVASAMCTLTITPWCAIRGQEPSQDVKDIITGLTHEAWGWSVDAKFSEENLRKSNIALRTNKFVRAYEIMCGRNYMVDYSIEQVNPEYVMSIMNEVMSIGQDHRAVMMFLESMKHVANRSMQERLSNSHMPITSRINFDYAGGMRVNPYVHISTVDLSKVESIRSSDVFGDTRTFMDNYLNKVVSLYLAESLYLQQLEPGERVVFKVITSNIIKDNLLSVPSIHNHLNVLTDKDSDGQVVEYTRALPCGVELQFVTSTWDNMRNKIIMIPYRPNFPDSELNYCHNWVYGSFVAHYTPQIAGGVNKRVFANQRETPVITNPGGILCDIVNIDKHLELDKVPTIQ